MFAKRIVAPSSNAEMWKKTTQTYNHERGFKFCCCLQWIPHNFCLVCSHARGSFFSSLEAKCEETLKKILFWPFRRKNYYFFNISFFFFRFLKPKIDFFPLNVSTWILMLSEMVRSRRQDNFHERFMNSPYRCGE